MTISALLFDKDGTLFDFARTWNGWSMSVLTGLAEGDAERLAAMAAAISYDLVAAAFRPDSIVIAGTNAQVGELIMSILSQADPEVLLHRVEFVGPQVGEELAEQGGLAMLFALLMILAYVAARFQWKLSVGAVAALIHDVIVTLGFFAATQMAFDLSVLAAVLAVIGYSLNDTIVVFDRIRENFRSIRNGEPETIMNVSLNQTLARTLMTSGTTLLVLFALFFLGGQAIHSFSVALLVGIFVGTYSSIYVASALALELNLTLIDLMPPKKEDLVDDMP